MIDEPADSAELDALDAYLDEIHAGSSCQRERLAAEHPGLRPLFEVLEVLDDIAGPSALTAAAAAASPPAGSAGRFGSYELIEEIGRGGMGVVYKARQSDLDRIVALKMILSSHLASAEHVRRFQIEARAAARVRHANIVHIHEVGQHAGQHYFSMEYVEGTNLACRMAAEPLAWDKSIRLLEQVARAVAHLHRQGVVHRDLKPSNILLDGDDRALVTDFGLAKALQSDSQATQSGTILGTPSYMAPEQAAGRNVEVGPLSDIYSLGAILYELLTGRPPFREKTPLDTVLKVMTSEPELPRKIKRAIPRGLELIAMKCLARAPADRYQTADDLADDLCRYIKEEPLAAQPPNIVERAARWARREPALASRLAVLGAFFVVQNLNAPYAWGSAEDWDFHLWMLGLMGVWLVSAVVLERSMKVRRWSIPARFLWGTLDAALLLAMLLISTGVASSLVMGYPMLIVGSALWSRVRFVWYMTGLSLASYGLLVADYYGRRHDELSAYINATWDRHAVFVVSLLAIGAVVAYLVGRLRALSEFIGGTRDQDA